MKQHDVDEVLITFKDETQTLAIWWCELNNGTWPGEIPIEKPNTFHICVSRNFLARDGTAERGTTTGRLFWGIIDTIGLRECLRQQKSHSFPGELFDEWYDEIAKEPVCQLSS
jgi:hypothetical protein